MSDTRVIVGGLASIGVAALAGFLWFSNGMHSDAAAQAEDTAGPNLVIDVAGSVTGRIVIDLRADLAPGHVARIVALAEAGAYDKVVFHRVIDGFMAQTGDVAYGKLGGDISMAGRGGSDLPDLKAEFSALPFDAGVLGMARSADPDSANSQFFITLAPAPHLNGDYTVLGSVISGMEVVNAIKKGDGNNGGVVTDPDYMAKVTVEK